MWELEEIVAMNRRPVARTTVLYEVGAHAVVDHKMYSEGDSRLTCRANGCSSVSEDELRQQPCTGGRRSGW